MLKKSVFDRKFRVDRWDAIQNALQTSSSETTSARLLLAAENSAKLLLARNFPSFQQPIVIDVYKDGTGILTDGKFGPVYAKELKGNGWVGWSSDCTKSQDIDIIFEFSAVRKFKDVLLIVNVDRSRRNVLINKSQIFLSTLDDRFSNTSFLQFCPRNFSYKDIYTMSIYIVTM